MLDALTDLVLPRSCLGCGRRGIVLCRVCCTPDPRLVGGGRSELIVAAAGPYRGALRLALLAYKERGRRDLATPLGGLLAAAVRLLDLLDVSPAGAVLVPVPSARRAAAARGGDHVARLVRRTRIPAAPRTLWIASRVRDSAGLSAAERSENLGGAFRAHAPPVRGCAAVLVDDILTTGATLAESRRALLGAGWTVAGAAVVAWTPARRR